MNQINLAPGIKGNARTFAAHIINGDYQAVINTDIANTWFDKVFDRQGNKLVAFAIRVALQKRTPAHGNIVEHLVITAKARNKNPFTAGMNKYTLVHVIGNYSQSNQDANIIMRILAKHEPERLGKALKATYKKTAMTPRSHARRRGLPGNTIAKVFNTYRGNTKTTGANTRTRTTTASSVNNAQIKALQNQISILTSQIRNLSTGQTSNQNASRGGTNGRGKRVKPQPTWVPGRGNAPVFRAPPTATKNGQRRKVTAKRKM
jgi:hypothetical protein